MLLCRHLRVNYIILHELVHVMCQFRGGLVSIPQCIAVLDNCIRDFNPQNTCSCHVIKFVNKSRNADNEQFNMVATKRCALGGL